MKHVRLELDARGREAEIHPMMDLLANASFVERAKTTHWNYADGGLGIMHYVHGDQERFRERVAGIDDVTDFAVTAVDDGTFYAYLRCTVSEPARAMFTALTQDRLVVHHPVEWTPDGTQLVSVVGSGAAIQAAVDDLPALVDVTIHEIGGIRRASEAVESLLSERQREALEQAVALGYYDVPRSASVEDVADAIGCARSTAAEHLRKSEAAVLTSVVRDR